MKLPVRCLAVLALCLAGENVAAQTYLWGLSPGSGYVNGKTYAEAQSYCQASGGELATREELIAAHANGFSLCAYGWLLGGIGGYVVSGHRPGCGHEGWNGGTAYQPTKKLGAYCVGPAVPPGTVNVELLKAPAPEG